MKRRKDPTNTFLIRRKFDAEMKRRFAALRKLIWDAFISQDSLGLKINAAALPGVRAWAFLRSDEKVAAFMTWLKMQEDEAIFDVIAGTPIAAAQKRAWMNLYIRSAYQKGMAQSAANLRGAGVTVTDSWLDTAFFSPVEDLRAMSNPYRAGRVKANTSMVFGEFSVMDRLVRLTSPPELAIEPSIRASVSDAFAGLPPAG